MGMFSEWTNGLAQGQFGKDEAGRLAFFPHGWRKTGYLAEDRLLRSPLDSAHLSGIVCRIGQASTQFVLFKMVGGS